MSEIDLAKIEAERGRIRDAYLQADRDGSTARGLIADPLGEMYGNQVL